LFHGGTPVLEVLLEKREFVKCITAESTAGSPLLRLVENSVFSAGKNGAGPNAFI
jgi:hypothetical protein